MTPIPATVPMPFLCGRHLSSSSPISSTNTTHKTCQTPKDKQQRLHLAMTHHNDRVQASLPMSPLKPPHQRHNVLPMGLLLDGIQEFTIFIIRYAWNVMGRVFHHSCYILVFFLSLWILALIALQISSTLWSVVVLGDTLHRPSLL